MEENNKDRSLQGSNLNYTRINNTRIYNTRIYNTIIKIDIFNSHKIKNVFVFLKNQPKWLIALGIITLLIPVGDYVLSFDLTFPVPVEIENENFENYETIPTWVKTTGPFNTKVFEDGSSISFDLGSTELMYLPTRDGRNVIVPDELEFSSITPVFGPYIEFDQKEYSTTDYLQIVIIYFWSNEDSNTVERLGSFNGKDIEISTKSGNTLDYIFTETVKDSGIFLGEIQLTGISDFDINGDGIVDTNGITYGQGPYNGMIGTINDDELIVRYQVTPENYITNSVPIKMFEGEISIYQSKKNPDNFIIYLVDWDINLDYFEKEQVGVNVISDSDPKGIQLILYENDFAGRFSGEFFISNGELIVHPGDKISVIYQDRTLPAPYVIGDIKEITDSIEYNPITNIVNT